MSNFFFHGAITVGYSIAGLFFMRFWKKTRDRLFAIFGIAFWFFALEQIMLACTSPQDKIRPFIYLVRLCAFILLIVAIIDKNRKRSSS